MASTKKLPRNSTLIARVEAALKRNLQARARLTVAYSGGIDSGVLLDVLHRLAPKLGFALTALHIHHGISPHANAWVRFCKQTCGSRAIPLTIVRANLPRRTNLEATAREARYRAYARQKTDFVALAHTLDDQAETLLLQLFRGAGLKGLSAMPELRGEGRGERGEEKKAILRPLLNVSRDEIVEYARRRRLECVEDESNSEIVHDRNFVRHRVLPIIAERYPGYRKTLARASGHIAEAAHLLDELAISDVDSQRGVLKLAALRALSVPRAKNVLRYFLAQHHVRLPGAARLDECVRQLLGGARAQRAVLDLDTHELRRYRGELRLIAKSETAPADFSCAWNGEARWELAALNGTLTMKKNRGNGISLARLVAAPVTARLRRGGERFRPDARRPTRSLKNLLQEAQLAPWERARLPLLYSGAKLVYVPGIGIDAAFQAGSGETAVAPSWHPAS